eukprot:TRINITY_DN490_c1_g1_i7.p1 TRINITY_DN490_c1_g1~~TRINITY_DN490_c1_g1_i7.p1  ORF type:complete len:137 (-),score=37.07 TRINITY_DN490_c1_g1_i7:118-528(-)
MACEEIMNREEQLLAMWERDAEKETLLEEVEKLRSHVKKLEEDEEALNKSLAQAKKLVIEANTDRDKALDNAKNYLRQVQWAKLELEATQKQVSWVKDGVKDLVMANPETHLNLHTLQSVMLVVTVRTLFSSCVQC